MCLVDMAWSALAMRVEPQRDSWKMNADGSRARILSPSYELASLTISWRS